MRCLSLLISLILFTAKAFPQAFEFSLSGNPLNIYGWALSPMSVIDQDQIMLTRPQTYQTGYVYYNTPQNLANCSHFTVSFEFRITESSNPTADGIAFFYISNPPTGFVSGGGIGLPDKPNGLVMVMDTYNNDGKPDNPLVSLRRLDGTSNYEEGSTTSILASDATNQDFIIDGKWHRCKIEYSMGNVSVSFDDGAPLLVGTTTLNINGFFGICAATGSYHAKHFIKNFSVKGAAEPLAPKTDSVFYCQGDTAAPLTATGSHLKWYENATGGTALSSAPTPNTSQAGTSIWYVSTEHPNCAMESKRSPIVVTVHAPPPPPLIDVPIYCSGQAPRALEVKSGRNILWYNQANGGVGATSPTDINTSKPDTFALYASQSTDVGCESGRIPLQVIVHQTPKADFDFDIRYACDGKDTLAFENKSLHANRSLWDFGGGNRSALDAPRQVFSEGSHEVVLQAFNAYCSDTISKTIEIGHPLKASFTSSKDTVCVDEEIQFLNKSTATAINGLPPRLRWQFGDGSDAIEENPKHTFRKPGLYTASLLIEDGIPCRDSFSKVIVVDPAPNLHIATSDSIICKGDKVVFQANSTEEGLTGLTWNFEDLGRVSYGGNRLQHAFDKAGKYRIMAKANYRACPDTTTMVEITVEEIPAINLGKDTAICLNAAPLKLEDLTNKSNQNARWLWNTGDTTSHLYVRHYGDYVLRVTVGNCSNEDLVSIKKDCYLEIPNVFSPDGDGENDLFLPRQLLSRGMTSFKMAIFNRWGQKVFETSRADGKGWDGKFNNKTQPVGVYVYQIEAEFENGRRESYTGNVTLIR